MAPTPTSRENAAQAAAVRAAARAALRREKIAARAALTPALHAAASARIESALEAVLAGLAAVAPTRSAGAAKQIPLRECTPGVPTFSPMLAFCWPHQGEFDARPLVSRLLESGWSACLPVVVAAAAPLAFRPWSPQVPLAPDRYGIPTPTGGDFVVPDVLLIPLVAVDDRNYRIGYGGGFFDRTLAALAAGGKHVTAIGVGFELARIADTLPGPHDIALDLVVTERGCCIAEDLK
ncbi:MAG: 5-formyltetrahydrofolate cyclo-ligase [Gammaproteobacteria bacterium]|nr:5-formyltetrahydrofolate cyclo-ligase [Gammaproteobacteria bacterium]MBU1645559.1 5-formyltetrahydrofolate cyclo-ligase [Gammaproteobacteria bacterium]MBU1973639.1 5-formyltetrahydrofolate cyclo-ligase [Gammaproteobacteria bacterium]